jgi:EAL and modified HD-GYP domain-containing signal transduction protein
VALTRALTGHRSLALLSLALVRARFCELLAPAVAEPLASLYLLGLFSLLDALLDAPMRQILDTLPIDCEMKAALMGNDSSRGLALQLVRSLELCDWAACETLCRRLEVSESAASAMYVESLHWASAMLYSPEGD